MNRNRLSKNQQRRVATGSAPKKSGEPSGHEQGGFQALLYELRKMTEVSTIFNNLVAEVSDLLRQARIKPVHALFGVISAISTLYSSTEVLPGGGLSEGVVGSAIEFLLQSFPGKLILYTIVLGSIGWTTIFLGMLLTSRYTEFRYIAAHVITALSALLINAWVLKIFENNVQGNDLFILAASAIAVIAVCFIGKSQFKVAYSPIKDPDGELALRQVNLLLNFTVLTAISVIAFIAGLR